MFPSGALLNGENASERLLKIFLAKLHSIKYICGEEKSHKCCLSPTSRITLCFELLSPNDSHLYADSKYFDYWPPFPLAEKHCFLPTCQNAMLICFLHVTLAFTIIPGH